MKSLFIKKFAFIRSRLSSDIVSSSIFCLKLKNKNKAQGQEVEFHEIEIQFFMRSNS